MKTLVRKSQLVEKAMDAVFGVLSLKADEYNFSLISTIGQQIFVDAASLTTISFAGDDELVTIVVSNSFINEVHTFTKNAWAFSPKIEVESIAVRALALSCFK